MTYVVFDMRRTIETAVDAVYCLHLARGHESLCHFRSLSLYGGQILY